MKKKLFFLVASLMIVAVAGYARSIDVSKDALSTFTKVFPNAAEINWKMGSNFYKASFNLNGEYLEAFISEAGNLIAVSRNILPTALPLRLQAGLAKNYSSFWVTELFEYASESETKYYISLESADRKTILQSIGSSDWSIFKKISK